MVDVHLHQISIGLKLREKRKCVDWFICSKDSEVKPLGKFSLNGLSRTWSHLKAHLTITPAL